VTITATQTVVVFVSLLAMFSPPATLGAAAAILSGAPRAVQRRLAWEIGRNYALVLLLAIWLGRYLLLLLGISSGALTATGGAALLYQGLPLMTRGAKSPEPRLEASKDSVAAGSSNWDQLAVVPLLFPVTIGGGTIAVVIAAAERYPTLPDLGVLSGVILAMAPVVALTFLAAGPVSGRLSTGAQDVLARFSGIVLVALATQLLVEGLTGLVAATPLGVAILGALHR
jgi:multiple antibiotic resistance protein